MQHARDTLSHDALSPVQRLLTDGHVFLTGATGFFGKMLIDKLFRSAPRLAGLHLMVRPKRGKDGSARLEELFSDPLFDRLRAEVPDFRQRVFTVLGDCGEPGLGISESDLLAITSTVNVVFHVAATVKFDENIKVALEINVKGTEALLEICKKCTQLKSVVHVSTAFAHCNNFHIEEKFYDPTANVDKLIAFVGDQSDVRLEKLTPRILGAYPNTYAFTKALAEDVVRKKCGDLPIAVFRPAIVIGSYREPIPGWIDNMYGPTGVVLGVGAGLLRTMCADHDRVADIVPVDLVINAIIATAWEASLEPRQAATPPKVTNYVSSRRNPITWGDFFFWNMTFGQAYPTMHAMWYYTLTMTPSKRLYLFYSVFAHFIPAVIVDTGLILTGRKPKLVKAYRKIHKFLEVIAYFSIHQWSFEDDRVQQLWEKLDPRDRILLPFRIEELQWDQFFFNNIKTMRWCLMNDKPETLPLARRRMARLKTLHYAIKYSCLALILYILYLLFSTFIYL